MEAFTLPTHCLACGAYLMGGATRHKPGCAFQSLIDEFFRPQPPRDMRDRGEKKV